MMHQPNYLLLCFLFLGCWTTAFATHNRGGVIEYTALGGGQYEVRVITYTKVSPPSDQADRDALQVDWGDGSPVATFRRASSSLVAPDVKRNVYIGTHIYSSGTYIISMTDPNRNDNIQNINGGNSIGISFYLEATLVVPASSTPNSSVRYLGPAVVYVPVGEVLSFQGMGYDPDGDIICYEMVAPKQSRTATVLGYQQVTDINPGANNQSTFDTRVGHFTWNSPQRVGEYNIAIHAKEYRNGVFVGATTMDIQIMVTNGSVMPQPRWVASGPRMDTLAPGTLFSRALSFQDINSNAVTLSAFSETIENGTATVTKFPQGASKDSLLYQWTPTAADVRCAPYVVTFRGSATYANELTTDRTVWLYVRDGSPNNCDSLLNCALYNSVRRTAAPSTELQVSVAPNPFGPYCVFQLEEVPQAPVQLLVWETTGKLLEQRSFNGSSYTYETEALAPGVYFYRLQLADGRFQTGKLIRE